VYIVPVTSGHVIPVIAAPVIGLVPISPVIIEAGSLVIPDFDRITKLPATPRSTAPGASCAGVPGTLPPECPSLPYQPDQRSSSLQLHPTIKTTDAIARVFNSLLVLIFLGFKMCIIFKE
jgi:hypothetical protein